jgi:hypothetical protein
MQQPAPSQSSPSISSFAGLLATLASSPPSPPSDAADDASLLSSSDLGEDVATLSYERALRAHARYRPANRDLDRDSDWVDKSPTPAGDPGSGAHADAWIETGAGGAIHAAGAAVAADAAPGLQTGPARESDLRSASVTIRLSRAECTRLHQRAAEAGLTVSAYLRSCAVEAEALREQVKQALAELRAGGNGTSERGSMKPERRSFFGWFRWLIRRER